MALPFQIPIFSTVDCKEEFIAPCDTSSSGGNPVLYVDALPQGVSLSVFSLNKADGSWEYCKFKDDSQMIISGDKSRQIMMEKGNYQIKCEIEIDDITVFPTLADAKVGDVFDNKILVFPKDKDYNGTANITNIIVFSYKADNVTAKDFIRSRVRSNRTYFRISVEDMNTLVYDSNRDPKWINDDYIYFYKYDWLTVEKISIADPTLLFNDVRVITFPKVRF